LSADGFLRGTQRCNALSNTHLRRSYRGGEVITSFPRNLSSARREPTTRKDARTRKKERQEAEKQALLEVRRKEIRRERTLVEAAVAEEVPDNEDALVVEKDTSNKKKSKKQQRKEELTRLKALEANALRRKLEMVSSEGGLGGIGHEGKGLYDFVDAFRPFIFSLPFTDYVLRSRRWDQHCTALAHLDLDADWDPSKHDAQMSALYGRDDGIGKVYCY
jgi:protein KRI1